jgi:signal peptidase I
VDAQQVDVLDDTDDDEEPKRSFTREIWFLLVIAVALALFMKAFLIQAFFIPSGSMERTLHGCEGCQGDRVLVNKLVYKFRDIHRGDIVVFNGKGTRFVPETSVTPPKNFVDKVRREVLGAVGFGAPGDKDFIKRVIGIPGDVVACCTNNNVTVNGEELYEPYTCYDNPSVPQAEFQPLTVPAGQLFLMGDHRDNSGDSRYAGTVPEKKIVGRAFAVFFPPTRAKVLPVPETLDPARRNDVVKPAQQSPRQCFPPKPGGGNEDSQSSPPPPSLPRSPAAPPFVAVVVAVPITLLRRRLRQTRPKAGLVTT